MTSPEPFDLDRELHRVRNSDWSVSQDAESRIHSHLARLEELATLKHGNELRARNDRLAANNNALNARATKAESRVTALEAERDALKALQTIAVHEALKPIYFADSSDYLAGLYGVIKVLDAGLWNRLEDGATSEHYDETRSAAEAARINWPSTDAPASPPETP